MNRKNLKKLAVMFAFVAVVSTSAANIRVKRSIDPPLPPPAMIYSTVLHK